MLPAADTIMTLHLIRRAMFSLSLILPLMPMPLRATLNISFRGVNIALTAVGPFFEGRTVCYKNGVAVSAHSIINLPLFSPAARIPHPDRQGSGKAFCRIFRSAILSFDMSAKSSYHTRNCLLWMSSGSCCVMQLNRCHSYMLS